MSYQNLKRCEALSKSAGRPCRHVALENGKCYYHGGRSTGPKTSKGKEICKRARLKHGKFLKENVKERKNFRKELKQMESTLSEILEKI